MALSRTLDHSRLAAPSVLWELAAQHFCKHSVCCISSIDGTCLRELSRLAHQFLHRLGVRILPLCTFRIAQWPLCLPSHWGSVVAHVQIHLPFPSLSGTSDLDVASLRNIHRLLNIIDHCSLSQLVQGLGRRALHFRNRRNLLLLTFRVPGTSQSKGMSLSAWIGRALPCFAS